MHPGHHDCLPYEESLQTAYQFAELIQAAIELHDLLDGDLPIQIIEHGDTNER